MLSRGRGAHGLQVFSPRCSGHEFTPFFGNPLISHHHASFAGSLGAYLFARHPKVGVSHTNLQVDLAETTCSRASGKNCASFTQGQRLGSSVHQTPRPLTFVLLDEVAASF
jgi:hypothetical protein